MRGVKPKAKAMSTRKGIKLNLLNEVKKCRIVTSLSLGMSVNDIAAAMKVAKPTIRSIWKRYQANGSLSRTKGRGRKRIRTARENSKIMREMKKVFQHQPLKH